MQRRVGPAQPAEGAGERSTTSADMTHPLWHQRSQIHTHNANPLATHAMPTPPQTAQASCAYVSCAAGCDARDASSPSSAPLPPLAAAATSILWDQDQMQQTSQARHARWRRAAVPLVPRKLARTCPRADSLCTTLAHESVQVSCFPSAACRSCRGATPAIAAAAAAASPDHRLASRRLRRCRVSA